MGKGVPDSPQRWPALGELLVVVYCHDRPQIPGHRAHGAAFFMTSQIMDGLGALHAKQAAITPAATYAGSMASRSNAEGVIDNHGPTKAEVGQ
jgi:hypothetical protein